MDATCNYNLGFAQWTESKANNPDRLRTRQSLQKILTGMSLISLCLGFSIFGALIIMNRHHADLNGLPAENSVATICGGIGAISVGMAFFLAACFHWRFWARRSAGLSIRRQSARLTFPRPEPSMPIAVLN
jgi:hypothetical protein